jgi:hypothetical protein
MGHGQTQLSWGQNDSTQAEPEINYHTAWKAYRLRRNLALFLLYSWLPVSFGLFYVSRHYVHHPIASMIGIFIWFGAALGAVWWSGEFRCPRCRRRYGALGHRKGDTNLTRGLFDEVCSNCKLRKFEHG